MNSQRQVSTFAIALLMVGLVIVVGLSSASITIDAEDLPGINITVIQLLPEPVTNETDGVSIVIDPRVRDAMAAIGELGNRTDILSMEMEELRSELISTKRELKMMRNSMNVVTILFGAFSVIAIGIVAMTRRS